MAKKLKLKPKPKPKPKPKAKVTAKARPKVKVVVAPATVATGADVTVAVKVTPVDELKALKEKIQSVRVQVAAGGKSDIDTVGARLDEFSADVQAIIERNPTCP